MMLENMCSKPSTAISQYPSRFFFKILRSSSKHFFPKHYIDFLATFLNEITLQLKGFKLFPLAPSLKDLFLHFIKNLIPTIRGQLT